MIADYRVDRSHWVCRLASHLMGKAEQAYATMPTKDASTYEVKAAVLRQYDISTETYHHRQQTTHLLDLASKWPKERTTVRDVVEMIVKEQLLDTVPASVCVWVHERKPQDSVEVGQLADYYAHAQQCPGNPIFCHGRGWESRQGLTLHGVDNILLITGCSKTLAWSELVPKEKILPEQVPIRCAYEDTVMFSLANIKMQLGGVTTSLCLSSLTQTCRSSVPKGGPVLGNWLNVSQQGEI